MSKREEWIVKKKDGRGIGGEKGWLRPWQNHNDIAIKAEVVLATCTRHQTANAGTTLKPVVKPEARDTKIF